MAQLKEHNEHCQHIVNELIQYYEGNYYRCPQCGCINTMSEYEENETEDKDGCTLYECPSCGSLVEDEDFEVCGLYDYFNDYLDIDYILDSNRELKAVRVMVACGGPNIYIDTYDGEVQLYWWTESGKAWLPSELCEAINDYFSEFFYM